MKRLLYMVLVCSCLLLAGCPLQTESPIKSDTVVAIPSWMPGKWTKLSAGKETSSRYEIRTDPTKPSGLMVKGLDSNGRPDASEARPSVLSTVGGKLFISVYDSGDDLDDAGYYHYAIGRTSGGEMQLVPLKEHLVSSSASGEELATYIKSHRNTDEYLEQKDVELYRRK